MTDDFVRLMLSLVGIALAVGLIVAALIFVGNAKKVKRYRPGRPFSFTPVWFLAAPHGKSRAGIPQALSPGVPGARPARPRETGGASERW